MKLYREIVKAKNNSLVPLFFNGHAAHSKYNPENEAENFIREIDFANFFLVVGVAGAYAISALHKKFPESTILAVDASDEDILFLKTIPNLAKLANEKNIFFSSIANFSSVLKENYFPALHGDLKVIVIASWKQEANNLFLDFQKKFENVKNEIASDFATQARFGKIWQKNIFENLQMETKKNNFCFPIKKTACIVAAGPSLDKTIFEIKKNANNFFIIATDTAFSILQKEKIFCDCVISIDGQAVSAEHFLSCANPKTLFVFDVQANPIAVRRTKKNALLFIETGHPLSLAAKQNNFSALHVESFGTVTIAALDFAHKVGFEALAIFGADFSYEKKPYARGTYFDVQFAKKNTKFFSIENQFCALMFRSTLEKISPKKTTTKILQTYKCAFDNFLKTNCDVIKNENEITFARFAKKNSFKNFESQKSNFNFSLFLKNLIATCKTAIDENDFSNPAIFCLLPMLAFFSNDKKFQTLSTRERINLAFEKILRYTFRYD